MTTTSTRRPDKQTLTLILSILNLVALIGGGGVWVGSIQQQQTANRKDDEKHHDNISMHMPFEQKIQTFVTRIEHDREITLLRSQLATDFGTLKSEQKDMQMKIDKLLERSGG